MGVFLLSLSLFLLPFTTSLNKPAPALPLHPFYVAVTEVAQNTAEGSLEVSCKFFADDFEETLQKAFKTPLDINSEKEKQRFNQMIPVYVKKHLSFITDGKPLTLQYVGYEKEKESVYCYFEVVKAPAVKQLQVINTLLHDFRNEQINIIHVMLNGKRQSTKLDYPADKAVFQF